MRPLKAGEFNLGYPDESSPGPALSQAEILSRYGSFTAYRRPEEHVGRLPSTEPTVDNDQKVKRKPTTGATLSSWKYGTPGA